MRPPSVGRQGRGHGQGGGFRECPAGDRRDAGSARERASPPQSPYRRRGRSESQLRRTGQRRRIEGRYPMVLDSGTVRHHRDRPRPRTGARSRSPAHDADTAPPDTETATTSFEHLGRLVRLAALPPGVGGGATGPAALGTAAAIRGSAGLVPPHPFAARLVRVSPGCRGPRLAHGWNLQPWASGGGILRDRSSHGISSVRGGLA